MATKKKMLQAAAGNAGGVGEYWLYESDYLLLAPVKNNNGTGIVVYERVSTSEPDNRFAMIDNDTGEITAYQKLSGTGLGYLANYGTAKIGAIDDNGILHIEFVSSEPIYAQLDTNNDFNVDVLKYTENSGSYYPNNTATHIRYDPDRDTIWTAGFLFDARNVDYQYSYGVYVHAFDKTTLADYQSTPVAEYNTDKSVFTQLFPYDLFEAEGSGASAIYDDWYLIFKGASSYSNNGSLGINKYNYQALSQGEVQLTYNNSSVYRQAYGGGYYVNSGGNKYVVTCGAAYHDTTSNNLTCNINVMNVNSFPSGVSWTEISPLAGDSLTGTVKGVDVDRTNNAAYFVGYGNGSPTFMYVAKTPIVPTTTGPTWWAKLAVTGADSTGIVIPSGIQYDEQGANPALIITGQYRTSSSESYTYFVGRFPADLNNYFGSTLGPFTISNASSSYTWDDQPGFSWEARVNEMDNASQDFFFGSGTPSSTATDESLTAESSSL
jgi:hypothetical protein